MTRSGGVLAVVGLVLVVHLVADKPVLHYDAFNYAGCSQLIYDAACRALHAPDGGAARREASALWDLLFALGRPAFHAPGAVLLAFMRFPWSPRAVLLLDVGFWMLVLLAGLRGLFRHVVTDAERSRYGFLVATSVLLVSPLFWQFLTTFMGELPVLAALAWSAWALSAFWARGRLRDAANFGAGLALGLFSKPVFVFFAAPIAGLFLWRVLTSRRPSGPALRTVSVGARVAHLLVAAAVVAIVLVPSWPMLTALIAELHLINEVMKVYVRSSGLLSASIFAGTLLTETFPLIVAGFLLLGWALSLRSRPGRLVWLCQIALLLYVCLGAGHRSGRVFPGFTLGWALAAGIGIATLRATWARRAAGAMALLAMAFAAGRALDLGFLERSVFYAPVLREVTGPDGLASCARWETASSAPMRYGDEYRSFRVPEILDAIRSGGGGTATVFVAFSRARFNNTTFQSWMLTERPWAKDQLVFTSNQMRHGGFGEKGGLSAEFFTARFVVAIDGRCWHVNEETELYNDMISSGLSCPDSPFRSGLSTRGKWDLPDGSGTVTLFERKEVPCVEAQVAIFDRVLERDPGNLWNLRHLRSMLAAADGAGDLEARTLFLEWARRLSSVDDEGEARRRFPYWDVDPELPGIVREAAKIAALAGKTD